jgi:hypothetical protein
MVPQAHVSHTLPRRLRIKVPSKKGHAAYFSSVAERLSKCTGVEDVQVNPTTGSLLVTFDCDIKNLVGYARKNGLFFVQRTEAPNKTLFQDVASLFRSYNRTLKHVTGGELDIPSLVFVTLLISGIWQVARGNVVMPAWYTAFYYALSVFASSKVDEFDEGENLVDEIDEAASE